MSSRPSPSDWSFDPFKLTEKDGYFYGRGSADDKFMAATFVTNLIRYKQEGYRPDRDIIVALDTDEEIGDANALGIRWLINNHRTLIDAEFALNEGGGVGLKGGKPIRNGVQTSEKINAFFRLEALNKGGHSSVSHFVGRGCIPPDGRDRRAQTLRHVGAQAHEADIDVCG